MGAAARFGELKTLFPKGLGSCTHKIFACGAVLKLKLLNSLTHTETTIKSTLISHGVAINSRKNKENTLIIQCAETFKNGGFGAEGAEKNWGFRYMS